MLELEKGKRNIIHLLSQAAKTYKDHRYVSRKTDKGWDSYTYSEVKQNVDYLASYYLDLGFGSGQNFAILSEGSPMWVMSEYSVLALNSVSVPLSVKLLPEEIPFRLNHSEVQGIFTSKNHLKKVLSILDQVDNQDMKIIFLDEDFEFFEIEMKKAGISLERGILFWNALRKGKELLSKHQVRLDEVQNNIGENDIVNISYTSGTTGNPKGIMLTHLNYYSNASDGISVFKLKESFRTLVILPVDHAFAHTVALYGALFKALDLFFLDTRGGTANAIKNIPINLKEVKPQFLLTVPALSGNFIQKMKEGVKDKGGFVNGIFERGLKSGFERNGDGFTKPGMRTQMSTWLNYNMASSLIFGKLGDVFGGELEFMVGGGALLDIKQQQFYKSIGTPIFQGYGLTEAAPIISSNTPFKHKMGTSGGVMPRVTCKIMRNDHEEAGINEIGEIVIKGDNVMKGYYKNNEASALTLRDGWLWTGDLAYFDTDGFLVVTGRNKALLISEDGEKYSPEGIEEAIVNCSTIFTHIMLYNNQNRFTTAVVSLDPAKKSLIMKGSGVNAYALVKEQFMAFMDDPTYKSVFQKKWIPKTFFIAPEPFTEDNLMVNSTLKMVRYKILENYKPEIDTMYAPKGSQKIDEMNIKTLEK
jgi:long-chain acyl-CoA synthetase